MELEYKIKDRIKKLEIECLSLQDKLEFIRKNKIDLSNANKAMILKDQILFIKGAISSLKDLLKN